MPLRRRLFASLWAATLLSNLGFWVLDMTLGWLITRETSAPDLVALVPAATMLPMFLLALPAGTIGDILDRRRMLIVIQIVLVAATGIFAAAVAADLVGIWSIIAFAFLHGVLAALAAPARQAILPSIVKRDELRGAIVLSAIGFNGSRALGPLFGGLLIAWFGASVAIFAYCFASFLVGLVLYSWQSRNVRRDHNAVVWQAARGVRHLLANRSIASALRATLVYFLPVSALWAFAPLIARGFAGDDSAVFGLFMMAIGLGAVAGGFNRRMLAATGFNTIIAMGSVVSAVALTIVGISQAMPLTLFGFFLAGAGWITVSAGINSHVLIESDPEYHARAIALVIVCFAGGLGIGSVLWGQIAAWIGVAGAVLLSAAMLAVLALAVRMRAGATPEMSR